MRKSHQWMYQRVLESDPSCNGRFFTGVLTTGIYCLPSCHARKPRSENVRFFPSCEAARAAGLRPCRKCHPDDFERGSDPVLETIEAVVAEVRRAPGEFRDARSVVRRSGFGTTRAFELFRQHFHATPADLLARARVEAAKGLLLAGDRTILEIAGDVGFESSSAFHERFRQSTGMTPAAYRGLRRARAFTVALPPGYPVSYFRRSLSRDPHSVTERLEGSIYHTAVRLGPTPAVITLTLGAASVEGSVEPLGKVPAGGRPLLAQAHEFASGLLGLDQDCEGFAKLARRLGLGRLVAGRPGLRLAGTPTPFDGLVWSIIGQQINFPFACLLRRRLFESLGRQAGAGLVVPPGPEEIAAAKPSELRSWQFSRQKIEYLTSACALVADGTLDLERMRQGSATRAERDLLAVRGLGPWSVNYLMMRSLGFADCVPLGDTGVSTGLKSLLRLEERPDVDATRRLMSVFSPYRSLATAHLWQFNQPVP